MHRILPPLFLLLALGLLITGFALLAVESPQASIELHAARIGKDEAYRDLLEGDLKRRQMARNVLLGCLFAGSGLMVVIAFLTMVPAGDRG